MNCEFAEIFVFEDFEVGDGLLGLKRDLYLNIVEFLKLSSLRKV
jgi:hypothetical protein